MRKEYDAQARRDRYYDGPTLADRARRMNRRVAEACTRLIVSAEGTAFTFDELADRVDVPARTLRRRYQRIPAAAYADSWGLPPADLAINRVLAPRERSGPVWPDDLDDPEVPAADRIDPDDDGYFAWPPADFFESRGIPDPLNPGFVERGPLSLPVVLSEMFAMSVAYARVSGFLPLAEPLALLCGADPELDAWRGRATARRAAALATALRHAFALDSRTADVIGHAAAHAETQLVITATRAAPSEWADQCRASVRAFPAAVMSVTSRISEGQCEPQVSRLFRRIRR